MIHVLTCLKSSTMYFLALEDFIHVYNVFFLNSNSDLLLTPHSIFCWEVICNWECLGWENQFSSQHHLMKEMIFISKQTRQCLCFQFFLCFSLFFLLIGTVCFSFLSCKSTVSSSKCFHAFCIRPINSHACTNSFQLFLSLLMSSFLSPIYLSLSSSSLKWLLTACKVGVKCWSYNSGSDFWNRTQRLHLSLAWLCICHMPLK